MTTYHQCPRSGEKGIVTSLQKHHTRHDLQIMLPAVAQLMPPVALDDLVLVNAVDCPEIAFPLIEKDCLVYGLGLRFWRTARLLELVLVVAAVEGHFYQSRVMLIRVSVVHGVELLRAV